MVDEPPKYITALPDITDPDVYARLRAEVEADIRADVQEARRAQWRALFGLNR